MSKKIEHTVSSGNVFEDLGLPDAKLHLAKADLVSRISRAIWAMGLTQAQAGKVMGISQPKVSDLLRGDFEGYSMERLMKFLNALGHDVRISVSEERRTGEDKPDLEVVTA